MQSALFKAGVQSLPHFIIDRGIDDHIDYFMVRIDPDKIAPVKS